jgi:TIR domain
MPLDQVARRYADEMFTTRLEEIIQDQQRKRVENRVNHARRGLAVSGSLVAEEGRIHGETVGLLAEARMETLVKAYERAGMPFDDAVLQEITAEVTQFCEIKKAQMTDTLTQSAAQTFGGATPPNMVASIKGQAENAVNSALARITRDLRIRRYEVLLDDRKSTRVYAAALGKRWDVFISHATEDKGEFVRPLAEALEKSGLTVWYDETTLKIGDSFSGFQTLVSEFCRDLTRDFLGLDFEQLSLADLITREPVRDLVRESEVFFEKGAVSTALERLALAHETLQKLAEQDSQETLTGFGGRMKFQYSSRDPLVNEMQSWLEDLILDHEKVAETLNMLLLGIDPHAYLFFRKSVPVILRTGHMQEVTFVRLPSQNVSDPETYLRCRDFIIEFSLRNDELFKA